MLRRSTLRSSRREIRDRSAGVTRDKQIAGAIKSQSGGAVYPGCERSLRAIGREFVDCAVGIASCKKVAGLVERDAARKSLVLKRN